MTGKLSTTRADLAKVISRKGGATVSTKVTGTTSVVVQGQPSPSYKYGAEGVKLVEADRRRRKGQLIYLIREPELRLLLAGRPLTRTASQAAAAGGVFSAGVSYRPSRAGTSGGQGVILLERDLDEQDGRLRAHGALTDEVGLLHRRTRT